MRFPMNIRIQQTPLHSNSPFCTEAYKTWENEGFYKTEFFAKWKQKLKNAEVIRFTF